jgi:hypothetical protein
VEDDQMLNKNCVMIAIDGRARLVTMAKIDIDTPYYKGEIEAMVLESAICGLVLGNIVLDKPNEKWVSRELTNIAAVVTRAQAEKEKKAMKPLKVPKVEDNEITVVVLKKEQSNYNTLQRLWQYARENKIMKTKRGNKFRYEVEKDVLFRIFETVKGDLKSETRQVVVPSKYHIRVMLLAHESIVVGHLFVRKTLDRI